ncbi:MAG: hypothetical protein AAGF76_11530 [Pseudomonadota bacterium]
MTDLIFFAVAIAGLAIVAGILILIGRVAADCPQTVGAARLGTLVVTTGFVAFGAGVVMLIGAALPILSAGAASGLYMAIGLSFIALGIGFQVAASMLREILQAAPRPAA